MTPSAKKILQIGVLSTFFLLIIFYALQRSHYLIVGIQITNVNLTDGAKVANAVLPVTGNAKNAVNLRLNGREISIDETGNFKETIALLPGYNIISIEALDKFGYSDKNDYRVVYEGV